MSKPPTPIDPIYGGLPKEWTLTSIGNLIDEGKADLQTGPFGTALLASEYTDIGTPVIAVKNIGYNQIFLDEATPRVSEEKHRELQRYELRKGDIIFGRKGAVDRRALIRDAQVGWLQGSDCIRLRILTDEIDSEFVSYIFGSPQYMYWIVSNAGGSTMPSLNQSILRCTRLVGVRFCSLAGNSDSANPRHHAVPTVQSLR